MRQKNSVSANQKRDTMKDRFGREISYMRISITDRCNLRCRYCMPEEGVGNLGHEKIISFEEIERIVSAAVSLGITKFRLTGGEPLARKGTVQLVRRLAGIPGVGELTMTTNGILLAQCANELKEAGLDRVNISLDSLRPERYKEITRGGNLDDALAGIQGARAAGLTPIKLNMVVVAGVNEDEVEDFARWTCKEQVDVRFIELMPIGEAASENQGQFLSGQDILDRLPGLIPVETDGVALCYRYPEGLGNVGFINPMSCQFCEDCNKIRLTSDGKIKPCLHTDQEFDLQKVLYTGDDDWLRQALHDAILMKEDRHHLGEGAEPIKRAMSRIGG